MTLIDPKPHLPDIDNPDILRADELTSPRGHKVIRYLFRDRTAWLRARQFMITGTDLAAILGWDPLRSAYAVYADKVAPIDPNAPDLAETNEAVHLGSLLEDIVAKEVARRTRRQFIDHGRYTIHFSREVPGWEGLPLGFSMDREITPALPEEPCRLEGCNQIHSQSGFHGTRAPDDPRGPGIYEGKTTGEWSHGAEWKETDDDIGAPLKAQVQVSHGCNVLGWAWGIIGGLIGGHSLSIQVREMERDDELLAWAAPHARDFWRRVQEKDPPPADGSESTYDAIKRLYPTDSGLEKALPLDALVWDGEYQAARALASRAKADLELYGNKLRAAIGDARFGVLPDGRRYSFAWGRTPKPQVCPKDGCGAIVGQRRASRPLLAPEPAKGNPK